MYNLAIWRTQGNTFLPVFERLWILPTGRAGWQRTLLELFLQLRVGKRDRRSFQSPVLHCNLKHSEIPLGKAAALTGTRHMGEVRSCHLDRLSLISALSLSRQVLSLMVWGKGVLGFLKSVTLWNSCARVPWSEGPWHRGIVTNMGPWTFSLVTRNWGQMRIPCKALLGFMLQH